MKTFQRRISTVTGLQQARVSLPSTYFFLLHFSCLHELWLSLLESSGTNKTQGRAEDRGHCPRLVMGYFEAVCLLIFFFSSVLTHRQMCTNCLLFMFGWIPGSGMWQKTRMPRKEGNFLSAFTSASPPPSAPTGKLGFCISLCYFYGYLKECIQ